MKTYVQAKLEALCARKVMKEREMDRISAGVKDWGEVSRGDFDMNSRNTFHTQYSRVCAAVEDARIVCIID